MLVTCPECGARYQIDGSLIPPGGRRVQCAACNHVWQQAVPREPPRRAEDEAARARPPLAEDVKAILREEAERDARTRRERGLVEIPPDAAAILAPSVPRAAPAGPLPDPEAINATLRAASERAISAQGRTRRRGGFGAGLLVGLILVGLGVLAYAMAPRIVAAVPEAAPAAGRYVEVVDEARLRLDRAADKAVAAVSGLLDRGD